MNAKAVALQERTRAFATRVIRFCEGLPRTTAAQSIGAQLIASASSADSNYRASCRARSRREFIARLGVVVEEADESLGWLQLLVESAICSAAEAASLLREADELVAIFVKSEKTARTNYESERARQHAARTRPSTIRRR